jgi:hypothetical protein
MYCGARPWPFSRFHYQSSTHRIQLRVPQRCPKVPVVERARIEPSLPDMPARAMLRVPIRRVSSVRLLQRRSQTVRLMRHQHQMNMIGHQAVAHYGGPVLRGIFPQQPQINFPVSVPAQNELPCVSALRHMMGNLQRHYPGEPCHTRPFSGPAHREPTSVCRSRNSPRQQNTPAGIPSMVAFEWIVGEQYWSGREDLNLRPPGPEPDTSHYRNLLKSAVHKCFGLKQLQPAS